MFVTQPKIFVSSTIKDLPSERRAALEAVQNVGGFPVMSEFTMEAQSVDSLEACLSKVQESDIYVLIIGGRYGWQPEGKESITEMEYQTALNNNIPILVFSTTYDKEELQKNFEYKVNPSFFKKTVNDAFELKSEMEKALKAELDKKQNEYFNRNEKLYSNLVEISFPTTLFMADLNIDKDEVKKHQKGLGKKFKYRPTSKDYAVSALYMHDISFPHDWIVWEKKIITFHNLKDDRIGLTKIIDKGTVEEFSCDEFYETSTDHLSMFKYLLRKCLETKLHKLRIKWIQDANMFAFLPVEKDLQDRWVNRSIEWTKSVKKATRKVVEIKRDLKDKEKIFNIKCLGFRVGFEVLEDKWYLSIKPDWVFLWDDFSVSTIAFKNIQWLKKTEKNMHVFNHFNFILRYLQPSETESIFEEFREYPYLKIGNIEDFDFAPIVPDSVWVNLEDPSLQKKLNDNAGDVELFKI